MEKTDKKKILKKSLQIIFPLLLGAFILYWTYRDFNFGRVRNVLTNDMNWAWMLFSLVFGITAQVCRGLRWKLTLTPMGENPKLSNCVYAIFVSYAASLIIPRVGEVTRCGLLSKYDNVSFAKALGTVVTERLVDTVCVGLIVGGVLLIQASVFATFFQETGTDVSRWTDLFSSVYFYLILICVIALGVLGFFLIRNVAMFAKLKGILQNVWEGILSVKNVKSVPLFLLYTIGIWISYFLEFYVAFFSFGFSADLGVMAAWVMFAVGSMAVIVPTPNGAGPWHFAVITMMVLYGVGREDAGIFALLVHGIQTFLIILLGIYGLAVLPFTNKSRKL